MVNVEKWFADVPEEWIDLWFRRQRGHGREIVVRNEYTIHEYIHDELSFKRALVLSVQNEDYIAMSVNSFRGEGVLSVLDKLFFDFDKAGSPETALSQAISLNHRVENEYGIKGMEIISGSKGAHLYFWFPPNILSRPMETIDDYYFGHRLLEATIGILTKTDDMGDLCELYPSVERSWSLSPRWKARVPYSLHEKTGRMVKPINPDLLYRRKDNCIPREVIEDAVGFALAETVTHKQRAEQFKYRGKTKWTIRPCIETAMAEKEPSHAARLAFVLDAIYAGLSDSQIVEYFKKYQDFKEPYTIYQIDRSREKVNGGMKPMSCSKLKTMGICDESCKGNGKWWILL